MKTDELHKIITKGCTEYLFMLESFFHTSFLAIEGNTKEKKKNIEGKKYVRQILCVHRQIFMFYQLASGIQRPMFP